MWMARTVAEGRVASLSLWTVVKLCTSAHHIVLCLQKRCVPGTLLGKVLLMSILDQDA